MKRVAASVIMLIHFVRVVAQPAPDFSMTDTDGTSWDLYEQLGLGKTVVLDFFFVDCVPCQSQSPEVSDMYQDYLAVNTDVLVLGISNRDADSAVVQFDLDYGIVYPTGGSDGGGDTITDIYQSWYPFFGWPWYAIICPDTSLQWLISPTVPGVPEIRQAVDECLGTSSIGQKPTARDLIQIGVNEIRVTSDQVQTIRVSDMLGREVAFEYNITIGDRLTLPEEGVYVISIVTEDGSFIHQKIRP